MPITPPNVSPGTSSFPKTRNIRPKQMAIDNLSMPLADTEYGYGPLPLDCIGIEFKSQEAKKLRWSFGTGKVAAPTRPYGDLGAGSAYFDDYLSWGGKVLYFACPDAATYVEIKLFLATERT